MTNEIADDKLVVSQRIKIEVTINFYEHLVGLVLSPWCETQYLQMAGDDDDLFNTSEIGEDEERSDEFSENRIDFDEDIVEVLRTKYKMKSSNKFQCTVCARFLAKGSLRAHAQSHFGAYFVSFHSPPILARNETWTRYVRSFHS